MKTGGEQVGETKSRSNSEPAWEKAFVEGNLASERSELGIKVIYKCQEPWFT